MHFLDVHHWCLADIALTIADPRKVGQVAYAADEPNLSAKML